MAFALIASGAIGQVSAASFPVNPAFVWADLTGISPAPQPGWTATNTAGVWTFAAPVAPAPAPTPVQITPLTFIARFSPAEQTSIATAAMGNVALWLWFNKVVAATYIDLSDPLAIAGVGALVSAGLITTARATEILTP